MSVQVKSRRRARGRAILFCAAASVSALGAAAARATTFTWDRGAGTTAWDDPINWSLNSGIPNSTADSIVFDNSAAFANLALNANFTVGSISVLSNAPAVQFNGGGSNPL